MEVIETLIIIILSPFALLALYVTILAIASIIKAMMGR